MADLQIENEYWKKGYHYIAGIDEAGRGPLAGPVTACALVFEPHFIIPEVNDSKQLSADKRERLYAIIRREALAIGYGWSSVEEITDLNIRQATLLAMQRAVANLAIRPELLLVDGLDVPDSSMQAVAVVDGDSRSFTIAAASIMAKVERDRYMLELHETYPLYHFDRNKGYGTRAHIDALLEFGSTPVHRPTFLKKILQETS